MGTVINFIIPISGILMGVMYLIQGMRYRKEIEERDFIIFELMINQKKVEVMSNDNK